MQLLVLLAWLLAVLVPAAAQLQLTILHNNDIHAHFDPVSASTTACREPDDPENPCYGGISRLVRAVNDIKAQQPNTLTLSGGDMFQGHLYYTLFKWQVVVDMVNRVPYDAMVSEVSGVRAAAAVLFKGTIPPWKKTLNLIK